MTDSAGLPNWLLPHPAPAAAPVHAIFGARVQPVPVVATFTSRAGGNQDQHPPRDADDAGAPHERQAPGPQNAQANSGLRSHTHDATPQAGADADARGEQATTGAEDRGDTGGAGAPTDRAADLAQVLLHLDAQVEELRKRTTAQAQADAVAVAVAIARTVVGTAEHTDAETLARVAQEALEMLDDAPTVVVHLHPADLDALHRAGFMLGSGRSIEIRPDAAMHRGDLFLDAGDIRVDAGVQTRLANAEQSVIDSFQSTQGATP